MLVSVPLFYDNMANVKSGKQLQECLKEWYKDSAFVSVREYNQTDDLERGAFSAPDGLQTRTNSSSPCLLTTRKARVCSSLAWITWVKVPAEPPCKT